MVENNPTLEMRNRLIAYLRRMERGLDTAGYDAAALNFDQLADRLDGFDTVAEVLYRILEQYNARNGNAIIAIGAIVAVTGERVDMSPYEEIDREKMEQAA